MTVQNNQISTTEEGPTCSSEIAIHLKNGTAVISGTACSNEEIVQAENAVNSLPGINHVFNLVFTDQS